MSRRKPTTAADALFSQIEQLGQEDVDRLWNRLQVWAPIRDLWLGQVKQAITLELATPEAVAEIVKLLDHSAFAKLVCLLADYPPMQAWTLYVREKTEGPINLEAEKRLKAAELEMVRKMTIAFRPAIERIRRQKKGAEKRAKPNVAKEVVDLKRSGLTYKAVRAKFNKNHPGNELTLDAVIKIYTRNKDKF